MWVGSGDSPALQWQPDLGQSSVLGTAGGDNPGWHGTGSIRKQGKETAYLVISFVIVQKPFFSLGKITSIILTTKWQPDNSVLICSGKSIYQDKLAVGSSGNTCARVQRDWVHAHACVRGGEFCAGPAITAPCVPAGSHRPGDRAAGGSLCPSWSPGRSPGSGGGCCASSAAPSSFYLFIWSVPACFVGSLCLSQGIWSW